MHDTVTVCGDFCIKPNVSDCARAFVCMRLLTLSQVMGGQVLVWHLD